MYVRACRAVQGPRAGPLQVGQGQLDDDKKAPLPPFHFSMASPPVSSPPFYSLVREKLGWWIPKAPKKVLNVLRHGVTSNFPLPKFLDCRSQQKTFQEEQQALKVLQEYMEVGAVIKNPPGPTRYLVPWFVIRKEEGGKEKLRLISDCRKLNKFLQPKHFKLDHWKNIFPFLRKGWWAAKIDLQHAYFHLALHEQLKPYVRLQVQGDIYEFQAACFGLSTLPQIWMEVMKVFQKLWREKGILCFVYLDDILVLNSTPQGVTENLTFMLQSLEDAGMQVNRKKSILQPSQTVDHLGFTVNLKDGLLEVPRSKLKNVRKELGKIVTHNHLSCRKMAAILGNVRSFLMAMPFLRAFTDNMRDFVNQNRKWGWDAVLEIPPGLQREVRDLNVLTQEWTGRSFHDKVAVRKLHSDSSNLSWAGVDIIEGTIVQEFWREKGSLHINVKELEAAVHTIKSLAKPQETVHLSVDNSVSFAYLNKGGGRIPHLNRLMRDLWIWCMEKDIKVQVQLVKSEEDQADYWSRVPQDHGDYTMDRKLFHALQSLVRQHVRPTVDMFASPGNHQLKNFVSRYPHWQAFRHNALHCPLQDIQECYANPPWTIISEWLNRLWENPQLTCMMITPYWVGAPWWPLLVKLHVPGTPAVLIPPYTGMFQNCLGEFMPAPKWPLLCTVLSGRHWKPGKYKLKTLTLF